MSLAQDPIIVLGFFRSGTSSVSRAISDLGVYLGDHSDFYPPDVNNEGGYFEITELVDLNVRFLGFFGMTYDRVRPLPENWIDLPQSERIVSELTSYLERKFSGKERWGFKQPLVGPLFPVYEEVFRRLKVYPHYVFCVRNPLEIEDSEAKWSFDEDSARFHAPLGELSHGLWLQFVLSPLAATKKDKRTIVSYEDFLEGPERILRQIVAKHPTWHFQDGQIAKAANAIERRFRRSKRDVKELDRRPSILKRTLDLCETASRDPDLLDSSNLDPEITSLSDEVEHLARMFGEPKPPAGAFVIAYRDQTGFHEVFKRYLPQGTWQTLSLTIPADSNSQVAGLIYRLPATIWIRKASWRSGNQTATAQIDVGASCVKRQVGSYLVLQLVPERRQLMLRTPTFDGPYELEIEFFLTTGLFVATETVTRLVGQK